MSEPLVILLAEDEASDVFIMKRTLAKLNAGVRLQVVTDGEQAIRYLSGEGEYANRETHPLPDLVLLDIKMPRKNGFEVLEWQKGSHVFDRIPVIMVSASDVNSDIEKAFSLGASGYLIKPAPAEKLREAITEVTDKKLAATAETRTTENSRRDESR